MSTFKTTKSSLYEAARREFEGMGYRSLQPPEIVKYGSKIRPTDHEVVLIKKIRGEDTHVIAIHKTTGRNRDWQP